MINKTKKIVSALASSAVLLVTGRASAAPIDTSGLATGTLESYISSALNFAIWAAGLLSVAFIILGGFQYITAGASKDGTAKAKTTLTYAIIGLVVVLLAIVIRNFVLGRLTLSAPTGV